MGYLSSFCVVSLAWLFHILINEVRSFCSLVPLRHHSLDEAGCYFEFQSLIKAGWHLVLDEAGHYFESQSLLMAS